MKSPRAYYDVATVVPAVMVMKSGNKVIDKFIQRKHGTGADISKSYEPIAPCRVV